MHFVYLKMVPILTKKKKKVPILSQIEGRRPATSMDAKPHLQEKKEYITSSPKASRKRPKSFSILVIIIPNPPLQTPFKNFNPSIQFKIPSIRKLTPPKLEERRDKCL